MGKRQSDAGLPREVIVITTYAQLDLYLAKFSAGELGLMLLLGRHGTGKSEGVRRFLGVAAPANACSVCRAASGCAS